jgi:transcriptional regulator
MYQPQHFREDRLDVQHELIRRHPFGLLISMGEDRLLANGIPFLLQRDKGLFGTLLAHVARANSQWKGLQGQSVLAVFQGPQAYVSPSFYATKKETGKVVPTWNYAMVQARGIATIHADAEWLKAQVDALTNGHEQSRPEPWKVDDAPDTYFQSQLRGIVGIEIEITEIEGKWKVSQNHPEDNRQGVAAGLADEAADMSALVRRYGNV